MDLQKKKVKSAGKAREHVDPRLTKATVIIRDMLNSLRLPQNSPAGT